MSRLLIPSANGSVFFIISPLSTVRPSSVPGISKNTFPCHSEIPNSVAWYSIRGGDSPWSAVITFPTKLGVREATSMPGAKVVKIRSIRHASTASFNYACRQMLEAVLCHRESPNFISFSLVSIHSWYGRPHGFPDSGQPRRRWRGPRCTLPVSAQPARCPMRCGTCPHQVCESEQNMMR
jgi:hypothetical protein